MKSNPKISSPARPYASGKNAHSSANSLPGLAETIGKKLLEIKRISGEGEMTELNMALWKHLK
jgi:hypothetical protein